MIELSSDSATAAYTVAASGQLITACDAMARGLKTTPVWYVKVVVDGGCLGHGKGGTKKLARNEAAKLGLRALGVHV